MVKPIKERIAEHFSEGVGYHTLRDLVFPEADFPKAFRRSSNGGPHGCAMAFGSALRRYGYYRDSKTNKIWTR